MNKKKVVFAAIAALIIGFIWVYNSKNSEEEIPMAAIPPLPEATDTASLPPAPPEPSSMPEAPAMNSAPEAPPAAANPVPDEVNKMAGLGASSSGRSR